MLFSSFEIQKYMIIFRVPFADIFFLFKCKVEHVITLIL